jgi:hypothetical protein
VDELHVEAFDKPRWKLLHRRRYGFHVVMADGAHGLLLRICELAYVTADTRVVACKVEVERLAFTPVTGVAVELFVFGDPMRKSFEGFVRRPNGDRLRGLGCGDRDRSLLSLFDAANRNSHQEAEKDEVFEESFSPRVFHLARTERMQAALSDRDESERAGASRPSGPANVTGARQMLIARNEFQTAITFAGPEGRLAPALTHRLDAPILLITFAGPEGRLAPALTHRLDAPILLITFAGPEGRLAPALTHRLDAPILLITFAGPEGRLAPALFCIT